MKDKVDGRKTVTSNGVFPYRLSEAWRRRIVEMFMNTGHSVHSEGAHTLGVIIEHCIQEKIPFTLDKIMNGYYIEKIGQV